MKNEATTPSSVKTESWGIWLIALSDEVPDLQARKKIKQLIAMLSSLPPSWEPKYLPQVNQHGLRGLAQLKFHLNQYFNDPLLQHRVKRAHYLIRKIQDVMTECRPKTSVVPDSNLPIMPSGSNSEHL